MGALANRPRPMRPAGRTSTSELLIAEVSRSGAGAFRRRRARGLLAAFASRSRVWRGVLYCAVRAQPERGVRAQSERSQSAVRAWSSAAACVAACGGAERQELSVSGAHLDRAATWHVRQGTAFFVEPVVPLVYVAAAVPAAIACAARRQGRRAARRPWHGPDRSCSSTPAPAPRGGTELGQLLGVEPIP